MKSGEKFYLTTAIAYANGEPHIGHAFEFSLADAISRGKKLLGQDVYFVTGMDEHGQKIQDKAKESGMEVKEFVDKYANSFLALDREMSIDYDFFVRTSDKEKHYVGAQFLWNKLVESGDIEKKKYTALYCVGCEEFKTEKDLNESGECSIHLKKPEQVEEENYFFKLSKYTEIIKSKIESDEIEIVPTSRKNEILSLLKDGLEDVSFSRNKNKISWGIPVPNDDEQVMYVWCDALSNYITALGYGTENFNLDRWSNTIHVIGKDILRFHAAIWPGMLLSAGLPLPKKILVHGFITSGGHKMSKSLGNVIDPKDVIVLFREGGIYGGEALRFILLSEVPTFDDGDITLDSIKHMYTAHLANGIGNLTNRIMKMSETYLTDPKDLELSEYQIPEEFKNHIKNLDTKLAVEFVMSEARKIDEFIQINEPFKVVKVDLEKGKNIIKDLRQKLFNISIILEPFMPLVSKEISRLVKINKMPEKPLFNRLP